MKKQLLFITSQNGDSDEGLSYAIDLAKTLDENIAILLLNKKTAEQRFQDIMTAVAFAEEGEHGTAREFLQSEKTEEQSYSMVKECKTAGIDANMHAVSGDLVSVVNDFLKKKTAVDMVLLSPTITKNGVSARELQKLVKTASRPVVTIAKQEMQHA